MGSDMSQAAPGGMELQLFGAGGSVGSHITGNLSSTGTLDAANESIAFIGHIWWEDGGTHTVDASGASSIGLKLSTVTFADGGTELKIGLAAVDATAVPGRAAHSSDVITFDVSKTLTGGGGGITTGVWNEFAPDTGSKTIAHGDLIAVAAQMTARGGSDSVIVQSPTNVQSQTPTMGFSVTFTGSYTAATQVPNCTIVASDGTIGFLMGSMVCSNTNAGTSFSSSTGTKEAGNYMQFPYPVTIAGVMLSSSVAADFDICIYGDPLGTPTLLASRSVDVTGLGVATSGRYGYFLFATPLELPANTPIAVVLKPTTTTSITLLYLTVNNANHLKAHSLGTNAYGVTRNTGAFAAQNSGKDRYGIGVLISKFEVGGGGGGGFIDSSNVVLGGGGVMVGY